MLALSSCALEISMYREVVQFVEVHGAETGGACSVWLLVHNMGFVLMQQIVWSRRHRVIWMLAAVMLARLQMQQEIVFAGRRGVNKYMEDEARKEGLLRRMPVAEIGWDDHNLSKADIELLSMISTAAGKLDWYRAKAAWDSSSRLKTPLCNAMMHAAFRCGRYADGRRIFWDMCEKGLPKNSITYNCAIRLFSMLGQYEHAYALFEEARDKVAVSGDPRLLYLLFSEMINSMAEAGNVTGVGEFLQLMTDNGFQIGEVT
ncbi:HACE1 [Symbiodinium sp. CCMP2592]|nr:HACE1 [Symbiodinium sp. CCMP2592]